ncbi:MAG TPA: carboxypeptidase regulatory-like domain-containing protein, partial [Acidobacteriota bacterium]|nr:carboxypeptidase regulatory-like domain-containing protein [Acidobacteriota bacterium]
MMFMAFRFFICLLFICSSLKAEDKSAQHQTLKLPPELQQKLACEPESEKASEKKAEINPAPANAIRPANDDCANATPVSLGTILSETCGATRDGSTTCQLNSNAGDIWYLFTSPEDAAIAINTFGANYDTLLSVHSACPGNASNQIACSEDCGSPQSCLTFDASANTPYWIRIGGFQQDEGRTSLTISKQGAFGGRITDANTNQGISGAQVLVYRADAQFVKSVTADSNGNYTAGSLADGKYIARTFNNSGYVDEIFDNVICEGLGCTPDGATLITVTGGGFTQVNFKLDLGGDIRGKVTDSSSGNPIEGVEVHIHDLSNTHISVGFTDAAGVYDTLDGLPAGPYIVMAFNHDGFVDELYDNVPCVRGVCSTSLATIVNVALGTVVNNIDFSLDVGGRIIGTVTDAASQLPISGVQVVMYNSSGTRITSASSNTAGEYTSFDGLPTGTYFVRTNNFKHFIDELHQDIVCPAGFCAPTSGTPVSLVVGSQTHVDFSLNPGAVISGKITDAGTGAPLFGLLVDIYDETGNLLTLESLDSTGNYSSLIGLPKGSYFLKTRNQRSYVDELFDGIPCVASQCNPLLGTPIFVEPGNDANNIDFALAKGSVLSGRIVESSNGLPLSDIAVLMFDSSFAFSSFGVTDGCGQYNSVHGMLTSKYIAQTSNIFGLIDELYDDVHCLNGCDFSKATPVPINAGERVSNVNFDLSSILLRDDFQDNQMDWIVKSGDWTEQGNFLQGSVNSTSNKASAFAPTPWNPSGEIGCSRCTLETAVKISSGDTGKLIIHVWRQNSSNRVELSI